MWNSSWRLRAVLASFMIGLSAGRGALAQGGSTPPPPPTLESGQLGLPENNIPGTSVPLFSADYAKLAGAQIDRANAAIAACNKTEWENAHGTFGMYATNLFLGPGGNGGAPVQRGRDRTDSDTLRRFQGDGFPKYPEPCPPKAAGAQPPVFPLPLSFWLLGGGVIASNGTGATTGVDGFFGPGAYLIDNRSVTGAQQTTLFGGFRTRAEMSVFLIRSFPTTFGEAAPAAPSGSTPQSPGPTVFFETGLQSGFGANSFQQNFSGVSGVPLGFGQQTVRENLQIPILIGVGIPLVAPAPGAGPVILDLYGGITLDSWTQSLSGGEAGAPAGAGFNGTNNRFTADPTLGVGLRIAAGDINGDGVADIVWGISTEVQFRPGSVVTARSSNFPSETYYGTVDPRANILFMGRVGIAFGGR